MSSNVEKIKERLDIVDVIGSYVKLEKAGKNLKGLSPFSSEKTPSFFVSPDRGLYYCFSSGKGGDVFHFIQEIEGVDFKGALQILADKAGIKLEFESKEEKTKRDELFRIHEYATKIFESGLLKNEEALSYLKSRGLNQRTIRDWRLGYSKNEWRSLYPMLKGKISDELALLSGLIKKNDNGEYYDTFRGRIIFPMSDSGGRVIAFSGRKFDEQDKGPKYLNSPETPIYDKSNTLYGYDKAKSFIRRADYAIMVEGHIDLIMAHQAGTQNTVATAGTSVTVGHLKLIKRLTNNLMIAYDSDDAGSKAALRAWEIALGLGMEVKILSLPDGKDPADAIKEDERIWRDAIRRSKHVIEFALSKVVRRGEDIQKLGKGIREEVLPYVASVTSSIDKSYFISRISVETGIKEEALWEDLQKIKFDIKIPESKSSEIEEKETRVLTRKEKVLREIVGILLWKKSIGSDASNLKKIEERIVEILGEENPAIKKFENDEKALIFEIEIKYQNKESIEKDIKELLENLELETLEEDYRLAQNALKEAEKAEDEKTSGEMLKKCNNLLQRIEKLKSDFNN